MIRTGRSVKLNVRPVYVGFVHRYYYEGPCRFGQGDALTTEYDQKISQEGYQKFLQDLKNNMPDVVTLLDPVYVERTDDWENGEEMYEKMGKGREDTDLYIFKVSIGRGDIPIEFAMRYHKPLLVPPDECCEMAAVTAAVRSRGLEAYAANTWEGAATQLRALHLRKVMQNTNVMLFTRFNSSMAYSGEDSFVCLDSVTKKLGVKFRYRNIHEILDQMTPAVEGGNPTTPGRKTWDLTEEEQAEAEKMADQLIKDALNVDLDREYLVNSLVAYLTVKKNLDLLDCNGFTAPCPDICSTRRINEMKFTFCFAHSLLNSQGIPSACEYDIDAVVSMMALTAVSNKAPTMGNTNSIPMVDGRLVTEWFQSLDPEDLNGLEDKTNLYYTFHSVHNMQMDGLDEKPTGYVLRHFAYEQGFGAVMRHDFSKDIGREITMARFSPDCTKLFVGKGTVVGGGGLDKNNCNGYVVFRVADQQDFFSKQMQVGNHLPYVFGDYIKELTLFGEIMGLEVITA